jgi:hypothetical protein
MRLIRTVENGERDERVLTSEAEYADVLREEFGIVMTKR